MNPYKENHCMNLHMSKIDPKTRAVLDFLRSRINEIPHAGRTELAKTAQVDPGTISRIAPKEGENPNYHPKVGTVLRLIEQLLGEYPSKLRVMNYCQLCRLVL